MNAINRILSVLTCTLLGLGIVGGGAKYFLETQAEQSAVSFISAHTTVEMNHEEKILKLAKAVYQANQVSSEIPVMFHLQRKRYPRAKRYFMG